MKLRTKWRSFPVPGGLLLLFLLHCCPMASTSLRLLHGWQLHWDPLKDDSPSLPKPLFGASSWTDLSGRVWIYGGFSPGPQQVTHDPVNPSPESIEDDFSTDNPLHSPTDAVQIEADLRSFTFQTKEWTLETVSSHGSAFSAMCGISGKTIIVFGGLTLKRAQTWSFQPENAIRVWNAAEKSWANIVCQEKCPEARYDPLVWCSEDSASMFIAGGVGKDVLTNSWKILDDFWKLEANTLKWKKLRVKGNPSCLGHKLSLIAVTPEISRVPLEIPLTGGMNWMRRSDSKSASLYVLCDNPNTSDTVNQLWEYTWSTSTEAGEWRIVAESGHDTWPGGRSHGAACTDSEGNFWLFGGVGHLNDPEKLANRSYESNSQDLDNDIWSYDVVSNQWNKVELGFETSHRPDEECIPTSRFLTSFACFNNTLSVYGGLACDTASRAVSLDTTECIAGDLWSISLDIFVAYQIKDTLSKFSASLQTDSWEMLADSPAVTIQEPSNISSPFPHKSENSNITSEDDPVQSNRSTSRHFQSNDTHLDSNNRVSTNHVETSVTKGNRPFVQNSNNFNFVAGGSTHSSIIFFGISLSVFAIFGVVMFFRRCVSCPPSSDNTLMKEPPPVRYTVIPDDMNNAG